MEKKELRDCPFCGSSAHATWDLYRKTATVYCEKCGARTAPCQYGRHKGELMSVKCKTDGEARRTAVGLWNKRTPEDYLG